jgi:hypothetical protein
MQQAVHAAKGFIIVCWQLGGGVGGNSLGHTQSAEVKARHVMGTTQNACNMLAGMSSLKSLNVRYTYTYTQCKFTIMPLPPFPGMRHLRLQ